MFTAGMKNTGTKTWNVRELRAPVGPGIPDTRHVSWPFADVIMGKADAAIAPGALDMYTFDFSAPKQAGSYVLHYALVADGVLIPDFSLDIPLTVTSSAVQAPALGNPLPVFSNEGDVENIGPEPSVRTGILIVDGETQDQVIIACDGTWKLFDETTSLLAELLPRESVTAFFKQGKYWFNRGKGLETTSFALRFIPNEANSVCRVTNWDRRLTRGSDAAYNSYRNILELRHNKAFNRTWLINELPMEWYLKGLGETSNASAPEFQKALILAARSYALFLVEHNTKHASEGYQVSAYADDQVYRGYGQEERTPTLTQSVEATRGKVVTDTSDNTTALTPYFSSSDGRTRDWGEVWRGSVAWLKSVAAPCDAAAGRRLRGHGVGMSASEALCQANQGRDWRSIIQYFYQGTFITKRWN